ncbi:MAG TPA: ATP-binding protein [Draconibacterium sp.]|nr:ATP-binding protein [Draconibacterium sp.]
MMKNVNGKNKVSGAENGEKSTLHSFLKYFRFRSSIYARVIYIIAILSVFLFISYGAIFKSVYEEYLNTVIRQRGDNIGSVIEGSLYYSMLQNDKSALQSTLDIINTMPGIDEVNMYDHRDSLVYSSFVNDSATHSNPNCVSCHTDFNEMFPIKEKSYRIIDFKSACNMNQSDKGHRQLLVRTPILNQHSCYVSACHAHNPDQEVLGSLIMKIPLDGLDAAVSKSSTEFFILATLTTLIVFSLLIFFTRNKIRKPLNAILSASEAVSRGDRSRRLEIKPYLLDDMKMVSLAFNNMLDNLDAANKELENWSHQLEYKVQKKSEELTDIQNELIHIERITSLGKLSSSVAHEINNPLSGILTYTKLITKQLSKLDLQENVSTDSMLRYLKVIETETIRCGNIVKGLLDFSRKDQENFANHHLHKILKDSYNLMAHQMHIADIHFYTDFTATSDVIFCNDNQIKQVCVALLVNALEAITENGEILIRTSNPDEEHIKVKITDNGVGIAPEDISRIFQPFFSAKQKASGIGLGLSIVHGIVQSHKGKIEVASDPGKGTTMSVIFALVKN